MFLYKEWCIQNWRGVEILKKVSIENSIVLLPGKSVTMNLQHYAISFAALFIAF